MHCVMQILELEGCSESPTDMWNVLLQILVEGFLHRSRYQVDDTSPTESMEEALFDDEGYTYRILSKAIGQSKTQGKHTNGLQHNGAVEVTS